jgi:hypothetical protein
MTAPVGSTGKKQKRTRPMKPMSKGEFEKLTQEYIRLIENVCISTEAEQKDFDKWKLILLAKLGLLKPLQ